MTCTDADLAAAAASVVSRTSAAEFPPNLDTVWTPPAEDASRLSSEVSVTAAKPRRGGFVCYLECNDERRARTAAALAASGHWVCSVSHASEAMHVLAKTPFDVFLIGVSAPCSRELIESLRGSPLAHVRAVRVACVALARVDARALYDLGVDKVLSFYLDDAQLGAEISAMASGAAAPAEAETPERDRAPPAAAKQAGASRSAAVALVPARAPQPESSKFVPAARYIDAAQGPTRQTIPAALRRMAGRLVTVISTLSGWIRSQWRSMPVKVALLFFVLVLATLWHHLF